MLQKSKKLHLVYIPGLGDHRSDGQQLLVRLWRRFGVRATYIPMNWADDEPWADKRARVLAEIDNIAANADQQIALVASSAGATAAVNAFAARPDRVAGLLLIAGKVNHPETIGSGYRQRNPAFVESAVECARSLASLNTAQRQRIVSRYAIRDEIVGRRDSVVAGAHNQTSPTVGHAITIALQLLFGVPSFLRFLRRNTTV